MEQERYSTFRKLLEKDQKTSQCRGKGHSHKRDQQTFTERKGIHEQLERQYSV